MENQFSRTELVIGKENVKKLHSAKVAIFGLGGVGSFVAEGLARAGVGNFVLVDNDKVSITNLNRQIVATFKTIGQYKVDVMKDRILDINPNAKVTIAKEFFMPNSSHNMIDNSINYIVDAIDTVTGKIELIVTAEKLGIPIISAMGTGNKLDPTKLETADIYETSICSLAKVMRKELKKRGIQKLKVVYSKEEPIRINSEIELATEDKLELEADTKDNLESEESTEINNTKKQVIGSVSFVPSVAGLLIAGEVVKNLIQNN